MAADFIYTNPEAARQAIAKLQLQASLAENASREQIARDQAQAARYATQSQMAQRDKEFATDSAIRREGIAAATGVRTGTAADKIARERGDIQYSTIRDAIRLNPSDPPTKKELEARIAASPQLTEDLANDLRSLREEAFKIAKSNADVGERLAKNYRIELDAIAKEKTPDPKARANLYKRINSDKNVLFDAATGAVTSGHRMPRSDTAPSQSSILGATRPGGVFPSAQEMQAAGRSTAAAGGIPTIADLRARITGSVPAFTEAADLAGLPPTQSGITPFVSNPDAFSFFPMAAQQRMASLLEQDAARRSVPRASDIAPPPDYMLPPSYGVPGELYGPPNRAVQSPLQPQFRAYDLQNLRPEYIPMDENYYVPQ